MLNNCDNYSVFDIQKYLLSQIAVNCGLPLAAIDENESIINLGVDSIIAATVNMQIEKRFGKVLPFS